MLVFKWILAHIISLESNVSPNLIKSGQNEFSKENMVLHCYNKCTTLSFTTFHKNDNGIIWAKFSWQLRKKSFLLTKKDTICTFEYNCIGFSLTHSHFIDNKQNNLSPWQSLVISQIIFNSITVLKSHPKKKRNLTYWAVSEICLWLVQHSYLHSFLSYFFFTFKRLKWQNIS